MSMKKKVLISAAFWGEWVCLPCGYVEEGEANPCPHCGGELQEAQTILETINQVEGEES